MFPTGKFAISGLRVFGTGHGSKPDSVKKFYRAYEPRNDKRSAWIKWTPVDNAYGYNIYVGTAPDKLYNCIMVYGSLMNTGSKQWIKISPYYFTIEAINENGVFPAIKNYQIRINI